MSRGELARSPLFTGLRALLPESGLSEICASFSIRACKPPSGFEEGKDLEKNLGMGSEAGAGEA